MRELSERGNMPAKWPKKAAKRAAKKKNVGGRETGMTGVYDNVLKAVQMDALKQKPFSALAAKFRCVIVV